MDLFGTGAGNPEMQKMMLAQALMGGGQGGPQNSFMGGLAQGISPMMRAMMMQKLMSAQAPQQPQQPPPGQQQMPDQSASMPYMIGGPVQP